MASRDADLPPQDQNGASDRGGPVTAGQQRRAAAMTPPDYRSLDYRRSTNYRGLDYRAADYRSMEPGEAGGGVDIMAALWRHRFAVIFPLLLGLAIGAAIFTTQPNVYRSTSKLLVETDQPSILDTNSGEMVTGVPGGDLLLAQLKSDQVLKAAALHPELEPFQEAPGQPINEGVLGSKLTFEETANQSRAGGAMVFLLHFDHSNPEVAKAAVVALSDSLEQYYADRSKSALDELKQYIHTAQDKLVPELEMMEAAYLAWREDEGSGLAWGEDGKLINPHREKQAVLQAQRREIEAEVRGLETRLSMIIESGRNSKSASGEADPFVVLQVIRQLFGERLADGSQDPKAMQFLPTVTAEDVGLARLKIDQELVPLQVERAQYASQFGEGHPSVVALDKRIELTRKMRNDLTMQEKHVLDSRHDNSQAARERREDAKKAVEAIVQGLQTHQSVLVKQMAALDAQIAEEQQKASDLAKHESDDAMKRRAIEQKRELLDHVAESMARVDLVDRDSNIVVEQLTEPTHGYLIAPTLSRFLMMGGFLGLLCGGGLAYLLESQAKTYHHSDEITAALGLPVLAHVPQDEQKLPKMRKGETYAFADLDPSLSVIHRPHSMASEAIRRLRTALFFDTNTNQSSVFQITSPLPEDGKSTVSANLAASIAQAGKKVVLVDADLRRPQLSVVFGLRDKQGVSELLDGRCDPTQVINQTPIENLSVIPSGDIPANPAEALSMPQFGEMIAWLRERFDYVIIDTPPLLIVTDPTIVAEHADGVVFTFRIRRGCRPQTKEAVSMLTAAGARVTGVVVNRSDEATASVGYRSAEAGAYHYRRYAKYDGPRRSGGVFSPRDKNFVVSGSNGKPISAASGEEMPEAELPASKT